MRNIILKRFGRTSTFSVLDALFQEIDETDMPGISLGYLFKFRAEVERALDENNRLVCLYDKNGKCNVIHESLAAFAYLTLQMTTENAQNEKFIEKVIFYTTHIYNVVHSEFKKQYDSYILDLDKWDIRPVE